MLLAFVFLIEHLFLFSVSFLRCQPIPNSFLAGTRLIYKRFYEIDRNVYRNLLLYPFYKRFFVTAARVKRPLDYYSVCSGAELYLSVAFVFIAAIRRDTNTMSRAE